MNESALIHLDDEAIMDYAALLADDILIAAKQATDKPEQDVDYVSEHPVLVKSEYGVSDVKTKEWIPTAIVVSSIVGSDTINDGDLFVSSSTDFESGKATIELVLNGAYRWRKLVELRDQLVKSVYDNLVRELSFVADRRHPSGIEDPYSEQNPFLDDDKYYSDRFDTNEFVREVTDESVRRAEEFVNGHRDKNYTRDQLFDHVSSGDTWKARVSKLRPSVRAGVIKTVYSALVDAGLV